MIQSILRKPTDWKRMGARWALFVALLSVTVLSVDARTSSFNKLDSRLQSMTGISPQSVSLPSNTPLRSALKPVFDGKRVRIELRLNSSSPQALAQLQAAGLRISSRYGRLVSGAILPDQLKELAKLDVVTHVYPYIPPVLRAVEGEGVQGLRANLVHRGKPAFDGKGIKVGILSDSFGNVSQATPVVQDLDGDGIDEIVGTDSQLSGDLPPIVELLKDAAPGDGSDEGRAMAEIVHEMAPGADLAFYTAWEGSSDFASGIIALASAGCQVIVDDVGYYQQPYFQDGEIANAVTTVAREFDAVYLSAAGNDGAKAFEGVYTDIYPDYNDGPYAKIPTGNDLHRWNFGDTEDPTEFLPVGVAAGENIIIILQWENPFSGDLGPGASCDYDFYALAEPYFDPSTIITYSDNYQGYPDYPYGDPWEILSIYNGSDMMATCYLAMNFHHGEPAPFKILFTSANRDTVFSSIRTGESNMIWGQTAAADCMAVASVNAIELLSGGAAQGNPNRIDPAYYSSLGGDFPILFSPTGERLTKTEIRFKPDIASVDGTNTLFFYSDSASDGDDFPNFFGTSAAAPHAAAIAAMMRQANPALTAMEIRDTMRNAATDIFKKGVDDYTGWGLLFADDAIKAVTDAFEPGNPEEIPTETPTPEEPEATPTPEFPESTPTPEITPTPTATSTPVPSPVEVSIATNTVAVMDDLFSTVDLSNGMDEDANAERILAVRWNIDSADVKDFHVYVAVDGGSPQYLGRTNDANQPYFEWKSGQKYTNPAFGQGPQFGHSYQFSVFVITQSGMPPHTGPYPSAGAVEFKELSVGAL